MAQWVRMYSVQAEQLKFESPASMQNCLLENACNYIIMSLDKVNPVSLSPNSKLLIQRETLSLENKAARTEDTGYDSDKHLLTPIHATHVCCTPHTVHPHTYALAMFL